MPDRLSPKRSKNPFQPHVPAKMSAKTLRPLIGRRVLRSTLTKSKGVWRTLQRAKLAVITENR
eukprot:2666659-Lingulodinium_polyedra.AAC.1